MKISIITVVRNNAAHIRECVDSVLAQTWPCLEYVVVDGASTDGTREILESYGNRIHRFISEPDTGIYNALNKGISLANGDVVGILHADDLFHDREVLARVAEAMADPLWDACHGDLVYVRKDDTNQVIRYWKSSAYRHGMFYRGWMPAHPTLFIRRAWFDRLGGFDESLRISADYELMLRFLHQHALRSCHLPHIVTRMRVGGASNRSLRNIIRKTREDLSAWPKNGQRAWMLPAILFKNFRKLPQFIYRPAPNPPVERVPNDRPVLRSGVLGP